MDCVQFKISDIKYGWIFATIETQEEQIAISNSYLGGLQMPRVFLKAIIELLDKKEHEKWICWHGESNSYIWYLKVKDESLELCIYEGGSSFGLPLEGELLSKMTEVSRMILETNTLLYLFAVSICDALKFYSYGKGYDIWQSSRYKDLFPRTELSQLRKLLRGRR
ncbi:MAG: hypothetical protein HDT39_01710 [Lachnospiraceae bacterium]|nr:hypothetical protein [Lachnospiraceae bacterium]